MENINPSSQTSLREILSFRSGSSHSLAIDLGTTTTRIYHSGQECVLSEPSMVTVKSNGQVLAFGHEAKEMLGRTPNDIHVIRPLRNGVIADFQIAEMMLSYFIRKAYQRPVIWHPLIAIGVPSETSAVERRAVNDAACRAKASEVVLLEQPLMAAIGAELPVNMPVGNMIVDIGGGTTDIAVVSCNGTVYSRSLHLAGNSMDQAIMEHIKMKHCVLIGERTAEQVKLEIGTAVRPAQPLRLGITGRDLVSGLPRRITITDAEVCDALNEIVVDITAAIRASLDHVPPELSADIMERGIVLTGGGSLLRNLDERVGAAINLPVRLADDPFHCVGRGIATMLGNVKQLRKLSVRDSFVPLHAAAA